MPSKGTVGFCLVLTSYSKDDTGAKIVEALLSSRLAACIQVLPMTSHFTWKGKTARERESLMLIKARSSDFEAVKDTILKHHDYEVPEVVSLGIDRASSGYLDWMMDVTK